MKTLLAAVIFVALPAGAADVPQGLDTPLALELSKAPLKSALKQITDETGLRFNVSASVGNPKVTLSLKRATAREALDTLAKAKGLAFDMDPDGKGFLVRWREDVEPLYPGERDESPLETKVALKLSDAPLKDLLSALEVQSGLKFVYHDELGRIPVSAELTSSSVREVLQMICSLKKLEYKVSEKTVHITRIRKEP